MHEQEASAAFLVYSLSLTWYGDIFRLCDVGLNPGHIIRLSAYRSFIELRVAAEAIIFDWNASLNPKIIMMYVSKRVCWPLYCVVGLTDRVKFIKESARHAHYRVILSHPQLSRIMFSLVYFAPLYCSFLPPACIVLYLYIYIVLLEVHANQKHFKSMFPLINLFRRAHIGLPREQ